MTSVALIDTDGLMTGLRAKRRFVSASVVKTVMLVAYLRKLTRERGTLDEATAETLRAMITVSDNQAADSIYYGLGDDPIESTARLSGARTLDVRGYWAETYLSARDGARIIANAERLLPRRYRRFGMDLLGDVAGYQRWGVAEAAGQRWEIWFKGGWRSTERGQLVHQIALLRRPGKRMALAVFTDAMPTQGYAIETVEGIARRLLGAS